MDDESDDRGREGERDSLHCPTDVHCWLVKGTRSCELHGAGKKYLEEVREGRGK